MAPFTPHTPPLTWSQDLALHVDFMDHDHEDFITLLGQTAAAPDAAIPGLFLSIIEHLRDHFERENELMRRTGFFAYGPHSAEHQRVLEMLHHVSRTAPPTEVRALLMETLPDWFENHRQSMDAMTAAYALSVAAADH